MSEEFDLAVIGAGPGGYAAAIKGGQLGLKTCLIEKDPKLGGTCLHKGCIPTKALLHSAYLYDTIKNASEYGIEVKDVKLNIDLMHKYKSKVVSKMAMGLDFLMKKNKVKVINGFGRLKDRNTITVDGTEVKAENIILATGGAPKAIPGLELDGKGVLSSDEILQLERVPKSLLVVGAGAVGIEFASLYLKLGSQVTVVELLPNIVPLEDEDVSAELKKILTRRKMKIYNGCKVTKLKAQTGAYEAAIQGQDGKEIKEIFEIVLVAVGRKACTDGIGLESAGIKTERGLITVNGFMQSTVPNVYAIGDIVPTPALAHVATAEGLIAVEHIKGIAKEPLNYDRIPNCTFCDPQIASIGLSEGKARERGYKVKVGKFPFMALGKAAILGETEGFVKIISEEKYDEILGVHIIHSYASYMIGEAVAVLNGEMTGESLARSVHPHPTLSEGIMEAAHSIYGAAIHI